MMKRMLTAALAVAIGLALALPGAAEEKKDKKNAEKKVVKTEAIDTAKVKVSGAFLARWKKIKTATIDVTVDAGEKVDVEFTGLKRKR